VKSDIDRLMSERGFDAIVVSGGALHNYPLFYVTNGAPLTSGIVIKKRGNDPILVSNPMEREEALKSGLEVHTWSDFDLSTYIKETGSYFEAGLKLYERLFEEFGISGTVSFYGKSDPGEAFIRLNRLNEMLPKVNVTGEVEGSLFDEAYTTKDEHELAQIKSVAERTNKAMADVIVFIKAHSVKDETLVKGDGSALTVSDVKRYLRKQLMDYDLEEPEATIFAVGRDGGFPHSRGEDDDLLVLGKAIVFDLFPREAGGGYFHDMTRTICLGYAPDEVKKAYDEVMSVFYSAMEAFTPGEDSSTYQTLACDMFEQTGHQTARSHPGTTEGYVHSLGHGIGLELHSAPRFSFVKGQPLEPGMVFTVEPGLYYPDKGFGIRVEDTVYMDDSGTIHSLTPMPKELVIPVGDGV